MPPAKSLPGPRFGLFWLKSAAISDFFFHSRPLIFKVPDSSGYGDKRDRNKPFGPGGGTRRLHQTFPALCGRLPKGSPRMRPEWGRTRIDEGVKGLAFARHDTTVIGSFRIVANDNYAEAALAA